MGEKTTHAGSTTGGAAVTSAPLEENEHVKEMLATLYNVQQQAT